MRGDLIVAGTVSLDETATLVVTGRLRCRNLACEGNLEVQGAVFEKVASQAIGSPLAVEGEKPAHDATLEPGVHRFRVKAIVAGAAGSSDAQG